MRMALNGKHLIDGTWQASPTTFTPARPALGDPLPPAICEATSENVSSALGAASAAFDASQDLPPRWPADLLDSIAEQIMALGPALIQRGLAETALPESRLISERQRTVGQLKMFADVVRDGSWVDATIDTADANRQPTPRPDVRRMLRPRGPVAVFGASNFPFAFGAVGGDTASALASGNPVIVKGHPLHPGTSEYFAQAVLAALEFLKFPRGLYSLLQGRENELSLQLVKHPLTAAVGFTGSKKGGRALFDAAAARPVPIPVYAEMGSLNPLVLLPDAVRQRGEQIAKELAGSILAGGGQFCTKPGIICIVGESGNFVENLTRSISATRSITLLSHWIRDSFEMRSKEWSKLAGVKALIKPVATGHAEISPALFEVAAETFVRTPSLQEEAFGPASLIVQCKGASDVEKVLNAIGGSLTGTIHAGPGDDARPLVRAMQPRVGRLVFNGVPTGVEVCNAIVHGGPYPVTTDPGTTSVGSAAIRRFTRMLAWQDSPDELLPPALQNANPLGITRRVNGRLTAERI
jgi:2,5-dioxopentanoate dehydrogenase